VNNIETFKNQRYCVVKSAISCELRDFITQYALFDEMQDYYPEGSLEQVPGSHSKYADPAMESLLPILQKTVEENTGLSLDPTYSYYRVYREGDELEVHTDRPSCEISATLCFNYEYGSSDYCWPIYMQGDAVLLNPGDLIIYRGCDLKHWRPCLITKNESSWHVQGFFHYVDKLGPFSDYRFDQRRTIGESKKFNGRNTKIDKPYIQYTDNL
jgi:hypothetical protein